MAVADGRGSQWQQKEAGEREEVIGFLPLSFDVAFGDTLSERDWAPQPVLENRNSWSGLEDY